jgi:hypothetical protein
MGENAMTQTKHNASKFLKNKKIIKVDDDAHNVWHLTFDDGTQVSIWADQNNIHTNFGSIPGLTLELKTEDK